MGLGQVEHTLVQVRLKGYQTSKIMFELVVYIWS